MSVLSIVPKPADPLPILKQAQVLIEDMAKQLNESESTLATVREYAVELLLAIDEKQPSYNPRPHSEIVEMLHELFSLVCPEKGGAA